MNKSKGILFICNPDLTIEQIIFNGLDVESAQLEGSDFLNLVIPADRKKAQKFVEAVSADTIQFDWEINLRLGRAYKTLVFTAGRYNHKLVLIGAYNNHELMSLFEEMMEINNDQVNYFRATVKEMAEHSRRQAEQERNALDEMSRLNNELANLQRKLVKQNIELEKLNEIKNQFLGIAAHDLRNPLGNILNYAEFLEDEAESLSEDQIEFISHIKALSAFMLNLVNELLDFSAIETGNINLALEPVDLVALVLQSIQLNKTLAEKKAITLRVNPAIQSSILSLDRGKIEQVITNLLTNAIKYSHPNTEICVKIIEQHQSIVVSVTDQGQGISQEELKLLFKPFQTTSTISTGGEKSTGLGLFIVKRIIEAHNGRIWAESELNTGSTFYFSLPKMNRGIPYG